MTVSIRPALPGDLSLVVALIRELAAYERLSHEVDASPADIEAALFGPDPRVFCNVAEHDGEACGFALWFYTFSTFRGRHGIYLEDLFVRPEHRGHGIGRVLVADLARRCREGGLARLEWAVLDWNEPSIGFYRALGAMPREGWTAFGLTGEALARLGAAG